ncbi:hypothetical protein ALO_17541 [Acetonema longum DSM 6540]|uniref:Uncharacterized protein n=1 Tax=Acetonema longum DSM 6540 TaxID=1009370 RepID=F7NN25_9FIRM|nr:hypothetical protein ALO_17541 [Acetonema longum DSM 6540]
MVTQREQIKPAFKLKSKKAGFIGSYAGMIMPYSSSRQSLRD